MPSTQISEKRLAANRANAQKSTGPRTAAGKAKVSANARRTGAYSEDHRMSPRLEAHFRAIADGRTQHLTEPTLRALIYEWHMLQGHLVIHESRERALFNAGLEYGRGNEDIAHDWVLRQHGYIQALNRYSGWIQMRLHRVESAILSQPAGLDHLTQLLAPSTQAPPETATTQPTTNFEGTNPLSTNQSTITIASASAKESPISNEPGNRPKPCAAASTTTSRAATVRERTTPRNAPTNPTAHPPTHASSPESPIPSPGAPATGCPRATTEQAVPLNPPPNPATRPTAHVSSTNSPRSPPEPAHPELRPPGRV
ncbi:hypothetical protein [Paludibaculum fermentans]|uniref:hypothetical protein n=1 Tax=Paludibaculum fermentans TaxID=1473598 RepID=UPI003EBFBB9D